MPATYNIKEAQAHLPKLCRSGRKFVISNRDRPVIVALPVEDFEALLETLDILEDPGAMKAVRAAKTGATKYSELDLSNKNFRSVSKSLLGPAAASQSSLIPMFDKIRTINGGFEICGRVSGSASACGRSAAPRCAS